MFELIQVRSIFLMLGQVSSGYIIFDQVRSLYKRFSGYINLGQVISC